MERMLGRYSDVAYALMRIMAGFLFSLHGVQKIFGALGGRQQELASLLGLAGLIELVGGIAIAVGFFTAPLAFIASGEMAIAYFRAHAPKAFWPIQNGGELAVLYCFVFLYFATRGSGRLSLDAAMRRAR